MRGGWAEDLVVSENKAIGVAKCYYGPWKDENEEEQKEKQEEGRRTVVALRLCL